MANETIYQHLRRIGFSRRDFIKICGLLAATIGTHNIPVLALGKSTSDDATHLVAQALQTKSLVPVIWLEFQDCAGCTEALTRSHSPTLVNLVLNHLAIDYHETLFAAAGTQAEQSKQDAMIKYAGKYVLVVEGGIPTGEDGNYCTIGGRAALDILKEAAAGAAAIIATGNCATFGGIQKANPNPTTAHGVAEIITDKPVVNVSGCPAIPEVFTGTLAQFLVFGTLPALDELNRPLTYYQYTLHDRCLRRPFYEQGKFANSFDDQGARQGWCLYKLGCKGPTTRNSCATIKWDGGLSFPIQAGHPCLGCSEPNFWDGGGFYMGQSAPIDRPTVTAAGIALAAGAVLGAGMALANHAQKRNQEKEE